MAPFKLDDIDRNSHPFKVPEGYFEDLNQAILERTSSTSAPAITWYRKPVWQMALASVIILVVAFGTLFSESSVPGEEFLADVSDEEILIYLASNDLSESEILENFTFTEEDLVIEEDAILDDIEIDDSMLDDLLLEYDIDEGPVQI